MLSSLTKRQSGFSLLEVLVAFVILALSLGVIMRLFSTSLNNIGRAERMTHATIVAESALAKLGVESVLSEGEHTGEDPQGYRWQISVKRALDVGGELESPMSPLLYQIELSVMHGDTPLLTETTFRLAPRP